MKSPRSSVRIANDGAVAFVGHYLGDRYIVDPGQTAVVPWGGAVAWLGDNSKRDDHTKRKWDRRNEKKRLERRWSVTGPPSLRVIDLDDTPIVMMADDLDDARTTHAPTTTADAETLEERIAAMESEIATLRKKRDRTARKETAGQEPPEDGPTKVPVGA